MRRSGYGADDREMLLLKAAVLAEAGRTAEANALTGDLRRRWPERAPAGALRAVRSRASSAGMWRRSGYGADRSRDALF